MENFREIEEIKWKDIWDCWIDYIDIYEPKLRDTFEIKKIYVNYKDKGYFQGYDWVNKGNYQKRVAFVSEKPIEFLYFGTSLNKGTLHTLEMLDKSKDNQEVRAAIWIAAFTKDLLEYMSYEWRGKGYNILYKVNLEALCKIKENDNYYIWHHAMRKLLPKICFSYNFLGCLNINSYRQIIELAAISSAQILNNYIAIEYDSRMIHD